MKNQNDSNLGNKKVFAENLNYYLNEHNMMKKDLANKLGIGQSTVTDWTKMRAYPRMDKVQRMAEIFGIEMSDLVEIRNIESKTFVSKESHKIAEDLVSNPESLALYQEIKKLSSTNKAIVMALIKSLNTGGK
jgi:transcriptional regulator with XRE-family HTH domain